MRSCIRFDYLCSTAMTARVGLDVDEAIRNRGSQNPLGANTVGSRLNFRLRSSPFALARCSLSRRRFVSGYPSACTAASRTMLVSGIALPATSASSLAYSEILRISGILGQLTAEPFTAE
jgi:hypothetical protein